MAKVTIVEGTVLDPHHVEAKEPLPASQGQAVLIVVGAPTYEGLKTLVERLIAQGRWEEAAEVILQHQQTFYAQSATPFADLVITPLLEAQKSEEALSIAHKIPDEYDHDIAIGHIAFHYADEDDLEKAQKIAQEVRNESQRRRLLFLLRWDNMLKELKRQYTPEELRQCLVDEWGD